jgi:hypothetical protein
VIRQQICRRIEQGRPVERIDSSELDNWESNFFDEIQRECRDGDKLLREEDGDEIRRQRRWIQQKYGLSQAWLDDVQFPAVPASPRPPPTSSPFWDRDWVEQQRKRGKK